jgi:cytidine deaminase
LSDSEKKKSDAEKKRSPWPDVERRAEQNRRSDRDRRRIAPAHAVDSDMTRYNPADRRRESRRSGRDRRNPDGWEELAIETVPAMAIGGEDALLAAAIDARTRAHAQYSRFKVGAALESVDGLTFTGCNIENATYGLTLCAERVALVKALSEGHEIFTRIVVVADTPNPTPPCGPCRQLLWEYCGDIDVILAHPGGVTARYRLSALLPLPFDNRLL